MRSSFNWISGDKKLSLVNRALWYLNVIVSGLGCDKKIKVRQFTKTANYPEAPFLDDKMSPSRIVNNIFWLLLPTDKIVSMLGEIKLLDVGCGTGLYRDMVAKIFPDFKKYLGFDIKERPQWNEIKKQDSRCDFVVTAGEQVNHDILKDINLVMSQSAMEHFPHDLDFFKNIKQEISDYKRPFIQIHQIPTPLTWRIYGTHGYRGYNESSVAKILEILKPDAYGLYLIGGKNNNKVHYEYVNDTLTRLFKKPKTREDKNYVSRVKEALRLDSENPPKSSKEATFLVLVTGHNIDKGLFEEFLDGIESKN